MFCQSHHRYFHIEMYSYFYCQFCTYWIIPNLFIFAFFSSFIFQFYFDTIKDFNFLKNLLLFLFQYLFKFHRPTCQIRHQQSTTSRFQKHNFSECQEKLMNIEQSVIGLFSGTISISAQMTQCQIIRVLQPITKLYLFTIELKLRDDFQCFC